MEHTASEHVADFAQIATILLLGGLLVHYAPYGLRLSLVGLVLAGLFASNHLLATTGKPGRQLVTR